MAAFGAAAGAGGVGSVTSVDTPNINVTGSDLCLICCVGEAASVARAMTFAWDPAGNNEAMTGGLLDIDAGSYIGMEMEYLDDPTPANAPVRVSWAIAIAEVLAMGAFATAAADIVATDVDSASFNSTGNSLSITVPNVVSGDLVMDFIIVGQQQGISADGSQTEVGADIDSGSYARGNMSYLANSGSLGWACASQSYGGILGGVRIPDSGGGGGRIMSSLASAGGLAGQGGIAGSGGGLAN